LMDSTVREPQDETVARLAPEPVDEPEIRFELKAAYLKEKILSQRLSALAASREPGWRQAHARRVRTLADRDEVHIETLAEVFEALGAPPPERPETEHPQRKRVDDIRSALVKAMESKKDLEIRYVRAASLAGVEGWRPIRLRFETLAAEEARGRQDLMTVLSRFSAIRPED